MFGMSPLVSALVVSLAAFMASAWWFGVLRRRRAETEEGVKALAAMKWRECAGLVLQALEGKGYSEAPSSRQPGDGGTEFLLVKGDERCLVSYKHGTSYRLGEANVRDFANAVQLAGATNGILATLGSAEGFARDIARRYGVDLMDGRTLWPQIEPFAPATMVEDVRHHAANQIRRGQRIGIFASIALGLLVFVVGSYYREPAPETAPAVAAQAAPAPVVQDDAAREATDAMNELAQVAQLTDAERADRRATAANQVAEIPEAKSAHWSTSSTLVIGLKKADEDIDPLVKEACEVLVAYEELRFTRVQLEPPAGTQVPVRWRQCQ